MEKPREAYMTELTPQQFSVLCTLAKGPIGGVDLREEMLELGVCDCEAQFYNLMTRMCHLSMVDSNKGHWESCESSRICYSIPKKHYDTHSEVLRETIVFYSKLINNLINSCEGSKYESHLPDKKPKRKPVAITTVHMGGKTTKRKEYTGKAVTP